MNNVSNEKPTPYLRDAVAGYIVGVLLVGAIFLLSLLSTEKARSY